MFRRNCEHEHAVELHGDWRLYHKARWICEDCGRKLDDVKKLRRPKPLLPHGEPHEFVENPPPGSPRAALGPTKMRLVSSMLFEHGVFIQVSHAINGNVIAAGIQLDATQVAMLMTILSEFLDPDSEDKIEVRKQFEEIRERYTGATSHSPS